MRKERKLPEVMEIEVTTRCNFECVMCLRRNWEHPDQDIPVSKFEKIALESFQNLKKLILLGQGEPLMHPFFLELLKIAREYLPKDAEIEFTSNGSLLTKEITDSIFQYDISRIIISLDSPFLQKLQKIRPGATKDIFENLEHLSEARKMGKFKELAIATVLMTSNMHDLEDLIETCCNYSGIDTIYVSHVLPYLEELVGETCYETSSLENKDLRESVMRRWQDLLFRVFHDPVGWRQRVFSGDAWIKEIRTVIKKTREHGEDLDPTIMFKEMGRSHMIAQVQKIYDRIKEKSGKLTFKVNLPPIYPEKSQRTCPYIEKNATIIRVDGQVAPCFNYLHPHETFINSQKRNEKSVSYGNVFEDPFANIWMNQQYQDLRNRLRNMAENVPWSGDCPYFSFECFYLKDNSSDCYGGSPGCNICLYSTDQVRCIF
jgi:MoaA/NifB/PqqE/SkfB family radical SAM enzyme